MNLRRRQRGWPGRLTAGIALLTALSGCSGPFFYRDVIVPSYRQVDPGPPGQQPRPADTPP